MIQCVNMKCDICHVMLHSTLCVLYACYIIDFCISHQDSASSKVRVILHPILHLKYWLYYVNKNTPRCIAKTPKR